jgi:hypothetical protein
LYSQARQRGELRVNAHKAINRNTVVGMPGTTAPILPFN